MKFFYNKAKDGGVDFLFRSEATQIEKKSNCYKVIIKENNQKDFSEVTTKIVINAAGLNSGKLAEVAGFNIDKLK